jgi:hypothetical protein
LPLLVAALADSLQQLRFDAQVTSVRLHGTKLSTMCLMIFLAVEIFERKNFDVEVSSFLACAANGETCAH